MSVGFVRLKEEEHQVAEDAYSLLHIRLGLREGEVRGREAEFSQVRQDKDPAWALSVVKSLSLEKDRIESKACN